MKAYLLYEAGAAENLILSEAAKPSLKSGEVLIKVKAIGINPADAIYRNSSVFINNIFGTERPVILGWDVAGEIVEKDKDAQGFEIGDNVFALLQHAGGYAAFVASDAGLLARMPDNISYEEAAATPMAGLLAYQSLVHGMNIRKGDKILIHGAAGGVGHFAVQIAKHLGASITATSSEKNHNFIMSLGADKHIDYQKEIFWEMQQEVDYVVDTVGGETLDHSIDVVKPGGAIVSIMPLTNDNIMSKAKQKNVTLSLRALQFNGEDLRALSGLMSSGAVKPYIAKTYDFTEMAAAHQQVETRRTAGKIVVKV